MEVRKDYKQSEVGVIPEDWEPLIISRACKLINGRGFKPCEWKKGGLPIIRIQNLNGSDEYNYYLGSYDKKLKVENGQLLFAWSGSKGTSFGPHKWVGEKGLLNYHTWKIEINDNIVDNDYFLHALKQLTKYIEDKAHGASALVHVQKWEMEKFLFPCPKNISEQTAIATALNDADTLISSLKKLITKKRAIKQGVMQELLRPKAGWEVKRLGGICEIDSDNLGSETNPNYTFKYISLEDVDCGFLKNTTEMTFINAPSRARRKVKKGDILISTVRPNLKSHLLIKDNVSNWICSTGFSVLRCKLDVVNNEFIFQHFFSSIINTQIDTLISGSNYPSISSKDIKGLEIPFPTITEQTRIATILSDMDAEIAGLEDKLSKYKQVKQGMMQELLTGRVRLFV